MSDGQYCQDGRAGYRCLSPVFESETRLQYATILRGPFLVDKEVAAPGVWKDGVDEEGYEYLLCLMTADLRDDRVTHQHEWTMARKMLPFLFPGTRLPTPAEAFAMAFQT